MLEAILYGYLHRYKNLPLPGLGNIQLKTSSSRLDFPNRVISPTVDSFVFSPEELVPAHLVKYIGAELQLSEGQAKEQLLKFSELIRQQLITGSSLLWKGIGEFTMAASGVVQLNDHSGSHLSLPDLPAEKIIRSGNTHTIRVGEEQKSKEEMEVFLQQQKTERKILWWIMALVLFLAGVIALWSVSHFLPEEWDRKGNYHPVNAQPAPGQYEQVPR